MCGIAGYIGSLPPSPHAVSECLSAMGTRGPDSKGVYRHKFSESRKVCLIHSRLSIVDLDARSSQPMSYGPWTIILNGEIYNYQELTNQIRLDHGELKTKSDTEVLLRLLAEKGVSCLGMVEGMWAFAFYNESNGTIIFSRDRFGEKPLFLHYCDHGIYFGSEIKYLQVLAGKKFNINNRQILRYLINGYRSLYKFGETFFEEVQELPAGSNLISSLNSNKKESYWSRLIIINESMTYAEAVEGVRQRLLRSLQLRLRSDVPLAFCQSGGIDSNGLISIAKNVFGYDVHGFTINNTHERYAESHMVDQAVTEQELRHTSINLSTKNFLDNLKKLTNYHDSPVYTVSCYTHWLLMQAISENGYKVAISGTGADEIFSGYYDHHLFYLAAVHKEPQAYSESLNNWVKYVSKDVQNPLLRDAERFINNPDDRKHLFMDADFFASRLAVSFDEKFFEESFQSDILRNRMLNEMFYETIPPAMHEEDLNAMFWSVENRSPYLDKDLFEFSYSIPTKYLIRNGATKSILREALRGIVPDSILNNRKKMGFNAPVSDLLDTANGDIKQILLSHSPIFDFISKNNLEKFLSQANLSHSENLFLFYILSAKMFLEQFNS